MLTTLLVAQIVMGGPPLPPAEAAQVLMRVDSPANMTGRFFCTDGRRSGWGPVAGGVTRQWGKRWK